MNKLQKQMFSDYAKRMQRYIRGNNIANGFVADKGNRRDFGLLIALMHSELSEALEGYREGIDKDEHLPQYSSAEVELADAIIRILDAAEEYGFNVVDALVDKVEYNKGRGHKHGKKF